MVSLSFSHAGARVTECRRFTQEELEQLAPNMRRPLDCPRARVDLLVELEMDGELLAREVLPASGLASDGTSSAYRRFAVPAGRHRLVARLRDSRRAEGFDYHGEGVFDLVPGQNLVVEFSPPAGGFPIPLTVRGEAGMPIIEWRDDYQVGAPEIDQEHRELIELINEFHRTVASGAEADWVLEHLGEIHARISGHFALEERLMRDEHYPEYRSHKQTTSDCWTSWSI